MTGKINGSAPIPARTARTTLAASGESILVLLGSIPQDAPPASPRHLRTSRTSGATRRT